MTSPRPPGDPSGLTPEQHAARQLLPLLARVAAGERRDDLVLSWSTTSAHITTVTTIHGDGQVRQGQVVQRLDARPLIGHAAEGEVAQLCATLVASGFPELRPPPGPPAPPTVPPVQLGASAGGQALYASVPASELVKVPGFAAMRDAFLRAREAAERRGALPAAEYQARRVERALASPKAEGGDAALRGHPGYLLLRADGSASPLTMPDQAGQPFALVFTREACVESFFAAWPALRGRWGGAVVPGEHLFGLPRALGLGGLLFNPAGPTPHAALSRADCDRLAGP